MLAKSILVPLFTILFAAVFMSFAAADNSYIISDFADGTSGWTAGANVRQTLGTSFTWEQDGNTYSRSCLVVRSRGVTTDGLRSVNVAFDTALDLGAYREMSFDVYTPFIEADPNAAFLVRLTLMAEDGSVTEYLEMIEGGKWNTVHAKIGAWDGRSAVVGAEIALAVDTVLTGHPADDFYIDDVVVSNPVDRDIIRRFLFDEYTVEGGSAAFSADKSKLILTHENLSDMSLDAQMYMADSVHGAGAIRIRLANYTANDSFTLYYSTSDSQAATEDKSTQVQMLPNSGPADYYVNVGDVSQLRSIKLMFDPGVGHVELLSISVTPVYVPSDYDICGSITSCRLSTDISSVTFAGEVDRDVSLANQSGYIGIYEYNGTLPTAKALSQMTPLVKGTMATRFELSWQIPKNLTYITAGAFIATVVSDTGEYTLIAPPFYVENPEALTKNEFPVPYGTKGFAAYDISAVGDAGTGITLLELDVDRAFSVAKQGEQYLYRGNEYYLNSEYLKQLSEKIDILNKMDVSVLLRIYSPSNVNRNDKDGDKFGAISSYAAKKWVRDGKVVGALVGMCENLVDEDETFSQNIIRTANDLRSVYVNFVQANSGAKVYVSLGDAFTVELQTSEREIGVKEYLAALIAETAHHTQFAWEIAIESDALSGAADGHEILSIESFYGLRTLLESHGMQNRHIVFTDRAYSSTDADAAQLIPRYVIGTYTARFAENIDAYIPLCGENGRVIYDAVQKIYTANANELEADVINALDIANMSEAVPGFDASKLPSRSVVQADAYDTEPDGIKGKFTYYRFDSVAGIDGFYPSYYSGELRIVNDGGSVLSAQLDSKRYSDGGYAKWMGIANTFTVPEDLRLTPVIAMTVKVDSTGTNANLTVPLKVVMSGEGEKFEMQTQVPANEWCTLYFDTDAFKGAKNTEGIQILVGDFEISRAALKIKSIEGLSREYNDESLSEVITRTRLERESSDDGFDFAAYLPIGIGVVVAVGTVIAVMLLGRRKSAKH